jgi:Uma2 family endonuclease
MAQQLIAPWAEAVPDAPYPMSLEEFHRLPEDGRWVYELVKGRLVRMPHPSGGHGAIAGLLYFALQSFVRPRTLGYVLAAETGFVLELGGQPTELAADAAFVLKDRAPAPKSPAWYKRWEVAPDLVAEVASPDQFRPDMAEKAREWLGAGVKLVWVVWPTRHQVDVWRAGYDTPVDTLTLEEQLDGLEVLPGFTLPVRDLFVEEQKPDTPPSG